MEEGHRPEINRRVLEFPNPGGVAVLQEGRGTRRSGVSGWVWEGRQVHEI